MVRAAAASQVSGWVKGFLVVEDASRGDDAPVVVFMALLRAVVAFSEMEGGSVVDCCGFCSLRKKEKGSFMAWRCWVGS